MNARAEKVHKKLVSQVRRALFAVGKCSDTPGFSQYSNPTVIPTSIIIKVPAKKTWEIGDMNFKCLDGNLFLEIASSLAILLVFISKDA